MSDGEYLQKRIQMTGGGLATSGNYRRFYLDGEGNKVATPSTPARGAAPVAPAVGDRRGSDLRRGRRAGDHVPGDGRRRCAGGPWNGMPGVKAYFILAGDGGEYEEYVSPAMEALILK